MTLTPVLLITPRINRLNRLPYVLRRWKGAISLAVYITEEELSSLEEIILVHAHHSRIVFTAYIVKAITPSNTPFYTLPNGNHLSYPNGFYPVNTMRDLAIESISTTHCFVVDADMFPSDTIESSINQYRNVLSDHHNMIVVSSFEYRKRPSLAKCFSEGDCDVTLLWLFYR